MALLGYVEELITDKHVGQVNYCVNKLGGLPDFPHDVTPQVPLCALCNLRRPLVVQIYAPTEPCSHRTLYLFGCINPNCWNRSKSWSCLRVQTPIKRPAPGPEALPEKTLMRWCDGSDDWGQDDDAQNGNVILEIDQEDDESISLEEPFSNMNFDEKNANINECGAMAGPTPSASPPTAELEADEGEIISIDTPTQPRTNVAALLHETTPLPVYLTEKDGSAPQFQPHFIAVYDEETTPTQDKHVRELLQEYQLKTIEEGGAVEEPYEKTRPSHGDHTFHEFLQTIQANPGQILRYGRDLQPPLLLARQAPLACVHCGGVTTFEFQLIPTIISKLRLVDEQAAGGVARYDFGTILVFCCANNCWDKDTIGRFESVILQCEN